MTEGETHGPWQNHLHGPEAKRARREVENIIGLRQQQTAFHKERERLDRQNSWMAIPALAPVATVAGLETAAAVAARLTGPQLARTPLALVEPDPYVRVGDNWATRIGRRAHTAMKARVEQKPGWEPEFAVEPRRGK